MQVYFRYPERRRFLSSRIIYAIMTTSLASSRKASIDIMRGITLFLMLFVNDLYEPGVPQWMIHTKADADGMGLADWVFPGFLFMVGMSVPFAVNARIKKRSSTIFLLLHIFIRTLSLLLIGVLMLNGSSISPELTGMNRFVWILLVYLCIFLVWNHYPNNPRFKQFFRWMRWTGIAGLIFLALIYKSGTPDNPGWLITGWWGILGLIGWGYLTAAVTYLCTGEKAGAVIMVWAGFILLNILSQAGIYTMPQWWNNVFGVVSGGSVPALTLAGLIAALIIRKKKLNAMQAFWILILVGIGCLAAGFALRNWFIISKIKATPSWGMICSGISFILFALLYMLVDVMGKSRWGQPFELAGRNSLTTYLAPDIIYYLCWGLGIPLFFYKQPVNEVLAVCGSLVWATAMIFLSIGLSRWHIRLRL